MTFIAISTSQTGALIATDTTIYAENLTRLGHGTKVHTMLHLAAAVVSQGDFAFGSDWALCAEVLGAEVPNFDELVAAAPDRLRQLYAEHRASLAVANKEPGPVLALHIGRSDRHARYVIVGHSSFRDFEPDVLGDFFVTPAPFDSRPSDHEAAAIRAGIESLEHDVNQEARDEPWVADVPRKNLAFMLDQAEGVAPTTIAGWVALSERTRLHRSRMVSADSGLKVLVAGELHLTGLGKGGITQGRVHRFNDSGDEFLEVVAGTEHPLAQSRRGRTVARRLAEVKASA
jgi:hypothetical protein